MARYTPGITGYPLIDAELQKIAQAMETADPFFTLDTLYAAPNKYREGTVCLFDGVIFNPGSGAGVYCYRGGAWTFLG